ncbi:unnamed protein product, partial [Candidula unifasciata]
NILICGGILCESDHQCPGFQKCCPACGSKLCSYPIFKCGDSECKPAINAFLPLTDVFMERSSLK